MYKTIHYKRSCTVAQRASKQVTPKVLFLIKKAPNNKKGANCLKIMNKSYENYKKLFEGTEIDAREL
jgi:hypothetical protein